MIAETITGLNLLSAQEKLLLASELWDEVTAQEIDIPVSSEVLAELDRRMAEFQSDPSYGGEWDKAKARIRASRP